MGGQGSSIAMIVHACTYIHIAEGYVFWKVGIFVLVVYVPYDIKVRRLYFMIADFLTPEFRIDNLCTNNINSETNCPVATVCVPQSTVQLLVASTSEWHTLSSVQNYASR